MELTRESLLLRIGARTVRRLGSVSRESGCVVLQAVREKSQLLYVDGRSREKKQEINKSQYTPSRR